MQRRGAKFNQARAQDVRVYRSRYKLRYYAVTRDCFINGVLIRAEESLFADTPKIILGHLSRSDRRCKKLTMFLSSSNR